MDWKPLGRLEADHLPGRMNAGIRSPSPYYFDFILLEKVRQGSLELSLNRHSRRLSLKSTEIGAVVLYDRLDNRHG